MFFNKFFPDLLTQAKTVSMPLYFFNFFFTLTHQTDKDYNRVSIFSPFAQLREGVLYTITTN